MGKAGRSNFRRLPPLTIRFGSPAVKRPGAESLVGLAAGDRKGAPDREGPPLEVQLLGISHAGDIPAGVL